VNNQPDPVLTVSGLSKSFGAMTQHVVDEVSFSLEAGSIVGLLGPSGCGKTTTLRLIAGFERPDSGRIELAGQTLFGDGVDCPPERRGIGFVFQDYALFPHLSVFENVTFGLGHLKRSERVHRAEEVLGLVGLTIFRDRQPAQLSGGQQQRVALARALAPHPKLILLDEPFSSLDAGLRAATRLEIRKILKGIGATALLVTHDQQEAMSFSDHLIVMRSGRIEQQGRPEALYSRPRTAFVASFLGRTNLIAGHGAGGVVQTALGAVTLEPASPDSISLEQTSDTGAVMLSVRPEHLRLSALNSGSGGIQALVSAREFEGHSITYTVEAAGLHLTVQGDPMQRVEVGQRWRVTIDGPVALVGSSATI